MITGTLTTAIAGNPPPTLFTLRYTLYTLHSTPSTLNPTLYTLHPTLCTLHSPLCTLNPKPQTLEPKPQTPNPRPQPQPLNPTPGGITEVEISGGAGATIGLWTYGTIDGNFPFIKIGDDEVITTGISQSNTEHSKLAFGSKDFGAHPAGTKVFFGSVGSTLLYPP
jgi:hypothetical protein